MKLFIDDYRPAPPGWTLAKTPSEAIARIYQAAYDPQPLIVSLDYSLEVSDGDFDTFLPVAQLLCAVRPPARKRPVIYIHSDDPEGAQEMLRLLREAGQQVHLIDNIKMYAFYCGHQPEAYAILPAPLKGAP